MSEPVKDVYFRQLLAGRDFARSHPAAAQMANFAYLIGCPAQRKAVVVDPAWDVRSLVERAEADGYTLVGALVTHYHPDHVGGSIFGLRIAGIAELLALRGMKVYAHDDEEEGVRQVTGASKSDLHPVRSGDALDVGTVRVEFLHTPGHTPGSQCFRVGQALVAGDTLFVQGCGRVDLPGGDAETMYHTLTQKLATLPDDVVLYPGHAYGPVPAAPMGEVRQVNHYLRVPSLEAWMRLMG
jgi:glyoxylase-like metal-dependent hydrolase (beta-lactamase superfamily II)